MYTTMTAIACPSVYVATSTLEHIKRARIFTHRFGVESSNMLEPQSAIADLSARYILFG